MEPIESSYYYHIYNRGNDKQNLFLEADNYFHFLNLMKKHLVPVSKIFCYCLLKNHFHLLLRINDDAENPSRNLSNLFNAYTKAINKRYNRTGNLFQRPFKRKIITDDTYLRELVVYIHLNPETHNLTDDFTMYPYSSYNTFFQKTQQI